jgi:hypothetical protein
MVIPNHVTCNMQCMNRVHALHVARDVIWNTEKFNVMSETFNVYELWPMSMTNDYEWKIVFMVCTPNSGFRPIITSVVQTWHGVQLPLLQLLYSVVLKFKKLLSFWRFWCFGMVILRLPYYARPRLPNRFALQIGAQTGLTSRSKANCDTDIFYTQNSIVIVYVFAKYVRFIIMYTHMTYICGDWFELHSRTY